jgi:phosphate-selective porin OprO and OprP
MNRSGLTVAVANARRHARLTGVAVLSLVFARLLEVPSSAQAPRPSAVMSQDFPAFAASFAPFPEGSETSASLERTGSSENLPALSGAASASVLCGSNKPTWSSDIVPAAPLEDRRLPIEANWSDGLRFQSDDGRYQFHFGGIVQVDSTWLIGPQAYFNAPGGASNGVVNASATLIRRGILGADGSLGGQFDFFVQVDFSNASNENSGLQPPSFGNLSSSPTPLNVWMQIRDVPLLGYVRFGNQSKPIGMENNTSGAFLPFMERSDNMDAFYAPFDNGFALGVAAENWTQSERLTWRYGIFRPATDEFGIALNKYSIGARITALPWYEDDGRELVHIGLGYWGGEFVEDSLIDRARPLLRNAPGFAVPVLADTGQISGSKQYTIGPEFALVLGPWTIQAEYAGQVLIDATDTNGVNQGTVFFHGGYLEALYFLTGEFQSYNKRDGAFDRVVPLHDYHLRKGDCQQGWGAWQVGVRFGYLDLNDKTIQGGTISDWTVGLNCYLNPNMKFQLNYIAENRDMPGVPPGWINGVGVRAAYDF